MLKDIKSLKGKIAKVNLKNLECKMKDEIPMEFLKFRGKIL